MNRRYFTLDKYNTWYDWHCTLTEKSVPPAEPKENYVEIDGADGALDFTEALTGETPYANRPVSAHFMCSEGTHKDRVALLRKIRTALHGRKIQIIEPDDQDHFFLGRVKITEEIFHGAYVEFTIDATCDPWRYAINETNRRADVSGSVDVVIHNHGDRTVVPVLTVTGSVAVTWNGSTMQLAAGSYKMADLRLRRGANVVRLSGSGSVTFTYREAVL